MHIKAKFFTFCNEISELFNNENFTRVNSVETQCITNDSVQNSWLA